MAVAAFPILIPPDQALEDDPIRRALDRWVPWLTHGDPFSEQLYGAGSWRDQGWKLHVAGSPHSGAEILECVLPLLLAEGVRFKAVNSQQRMLGLNGGSFGDSQVGKFITVYPSDAAQAVRLAQALDAATRGLAGPRIPTDRPLRPNSLVHYRYGAFRAPRNLLPPQANRDFTAFDMTDQDGRLTTDYRLSYYLPPPQGVTDPFIAAGVAAEPERRTGAFAGRYLIYEVLDRSVRGGVFRAVDIGVRPARICLLKEYCHDVGGDRYGRDARWWGRSEAEILAAYDGNTLFPRLYDQFELDGNLYLAIEYVDGMPLSRRWSEHEPDVGALPIDDLLRVGRATADLLRRLHDAGVVFRDFKPANIICTPDDGFRLIDFGLAYAWRTDTRPPIATGTPPYFPIEQLAGDPPHPADDVYAWGAVMHHLACGARSLADRPTGADQVTPFARRPVRDHRPAVPEAVAAVIDRAVAQERSARFHSMDEVMVAWDRAAPGRAAGPSHATRSFVTVAASKSRQSVTSDAAQPNMPDPLTLAREVGDALCAAAVENHGGVCWTGRNEAVPGEVYSPDLYDGTAGIALFLAELAQETRERRYADRARAAARWLGGAVWGDGRAAPGLQSGEAGVGWFFLRLAQTLGDEGYVRAAELRARRLAGVPYQTWDLLYGAAGAAVFFTRLAEVTGEAAYVDQAREAIDLLLASSTVPRAGRGRLWYVPGATPALGPMPYLGLSHGAAGIGLALVEFARATGDERSLAGARDVVLLLRDEALATADGTVQWRRTTGDGPVQLAAQCHGATGIGQFLLRLRRVAPDAEVDDLVRQTAEATAAHMRGKSYSGLCHGIAGDGGFLLECSQATGEERWRFLATEAARDLLTFRDPERLGGFLAHRGGFRSPDLMIGDAGIGSFYLRLATGRPDPILL